jgi:hypothetical protein
MKFTAITQGPLLDNDDVCWYAARWPMVLADVRKSKSAQFKIRSCHGKRSSVLGEQTEIE